MNGRSQILERDFAERDQCKSVLLRWLDIWKNHLSPSMGPNGGSVTERGYGLRKKVGDTPHNHKNTSKYHIKWL
jgi:hypothetical protein